MGIPSHDSIFSPQKTAPRRAPSSAEPNRSGRIVLITIDETPLPIGSEGAGSRSPASIEYGMSIIARASSTRAINSELAEKIARSRSPTRSTMAWKSSCFASA